MADKHVGEGQAVASKAVEGSQLTVVHGGVKKPMTEEERLAKMADAARTLLECMGEDPSRPGLLDTPMRMAKAMSFFTQVRAREGDRAVVLTPA
jgi:GTP cyclohydrolase I